MDMDMKMGKNGFNGDKKRKSNEMIRFWEHEEPETIEANRIQCDFYRLAGKLQIRKYFGFDKRQNLTLDSRAITPEMVKLLKEFINLCEEEK